MNPQNTMVNERSQTQRLHSVWFHLYEISRKGDSVLVVSWGWEWKQGVKADRREGTSSEMGVFDTRLWDGRTTAYQKSPNCVLTMGEFHDTSIIPY